MGSILERSVRVENLLNPQGVKIFWYHRETGERIEDPLRFLYLENDQVDHMVAGLHEKIVEWVRGLEQHERPDMVVTVTMGALGYDSKLKDRMEAHPELFEGLQFRWIGAQFYDGVGERLEEGRFVDLPDDVEGKRVLLLEDLGDSGGSIVALRDKLMGLGAKYVKPVALFNKERAEDRLKNVEMIRYGLVPDHVWIITPRERVETLRDRLGYWLDNGADYDSVVGILQNIGYDSEIIEDVLPVIYQKEIMGRAISELMAKGAQMEDILYIIKYLNREKLFKVDMGKKDLAEDEIEEHVKYRYMLEGFYRRVGAMLDSGYSVDHIERYLNYLSYDMKYFYRHIGEAVRRYDQNKTED